MAAEEVETVFWTEDKDALIRAAKLLGFQPKWDTQELIISIPKTFRFNYTLGISLNPIDSRDRIYYDHECPPLANKDMPVLIFGYSSLSSRMHYWSYDGLLERIAPLENDDRDQSFAHEWIKLQIGKLIALGNLNTAVRPRLSRVLKSYAKDRKGGFLIEDFFKAHPEYSEGPAGTARMEWYLDNYYRRTERVDIGEVIYRYSLEKLQEGAV